MMCGTLKDHIEMIFHAIDRDGNGVLGVNDMVKLFARFGTLITEVTVLSRSLAKYSSKNREKFV